MHICVSVYFLKKSQPQCRTQEDTGFGGLNGGNIKIASPNRFARLKTFSCNRRVEKPQTLFLEKYLVLGRKWIFLGGGSIEGAPKMVLARFHVFLQYPSKQEAKCLNQESTTCPNSIVLFCQWETISPNKIN